MIDRKRILREVKRLPTMSQSFAKMSKLINDEKASMSDFERVLRPDPALTADVLRIANSPYFSASREIRSVQHALLLLGSKRLFELSASVALAGVLPERIAGYEMPTESYWAHCIAVAVFSERMAQELDVADPGPCFTAGLLHDIGKLVIGVFLEEHAEEVPAKIYASETTFVKLEGSLLGVDHCEVGAMLAKNWNLPESICDVIRWHHCPGQAPGSQSTVDLVHAADALAHAVGLGADLGELKREVEPGVSERLGIKRAQLEFIVAESMEQIEELKAALNDGGNN